MCDCVLSVAIARVHHEVRYRFLGMRSAGIWDLLKENLKEKGIVQTTRYSTGYKG